MSGQFPLYLLLPFWTENRKKNVLKEFEIPDFLLANKKEGMCF